MRNRDFKELIKKPNGIGLIFLYFFTLLFIALSVVFLSVEKNTIIKVLQYPVYGIACVLLVYSVYTIVVYAPHWKERLEAVLRKNAVISNLLEDYTYKTALFSMLSAIITLAFAIVNLISAIYYERVWYATISVYYFLLLLFRGGVLLANRICSERLNGIDYEKSKLKIYLSGGIFLLLIEVAMAIMITNMMLSDNPNQKGEIMTIATATYTFYKVTLAIINLVKANKSKNSITQALRNINLADACMSLVSLTVLMLSTFGEENELVYIKATTGFVACALIIVMSITMIVKGSKGLKELKGVENERG